MKQATVAEHQLAIAVLARRSARKAVETRLKAQGVKVSFVPLREINALANDYLAEHRAFFVVEAKQAIATWPGFARWRLPCADMPSCSPNR
jgi:hypothetical protein